jgi:hypothetical protein
MSLYSNFQTDPNLEKTGVWIDYGTFRVLLAFAGGANKRYLSLMDKKFKPLRQAIQAGTLDNDRAQKMLMDLYAEAVILDWETIYEDVPQQGIEGPKGELLPFTVENVKLTFLNLPNLFFDLKTQSEMISNFRIRELEAEAGNS